MYAADKQRLSNAVEQAMNASLQNSGEHTGAFYSQCATAVLCGQFNETQNTTLCQLCRRAGAKCAEAWPDVTDDVRNKVKAHCPWDYVIGVTDTVWGNAGLPDLFLQKFQ